MTLDPVTHTIMIWDIHGHLTGLPGSTATERMARLMAIAERMGIERQCVCMGLNFHYDPNPDDLRKQNDECLEALAHHHDRALGLVYLNPKHTEASLAELERCVAQGPMVGVKLWVAVRCSSRLLDPLVERAAELHAPILQHTWYKTTGNLPGESTSADLAELAARHPKAQFVCGHSGGDWQLGLQTMRHSPNVVVETGGFDPTTGCVEMAVRELGVERVIFGSDVPGRSYASQLAKVRGAEIEEFERRMILRDNLRRLLRPILESKGMRP